MAADDEAALALERVRDVQASFEELARLRLDTVSEAVRAGNSLRAVASVAGCSFETVRRIRGEAALRDP